MNNLSGSTIVLAIAVLLLLVYTYQLSKKLARAIKDSTHDQLTGLPNRRGFIDFAEKQLAFLSRNHGYQFTLVYMDLNGFKSINDACGHHVGDGYLVEFGEFLKHSFREADIVARLGGDEFVAILPHTDVHGATVLIEHLRDRMKAAMFTVGGYRFVPDAAVGYVEVTEKTTLADILKEADKRMMRNKPVGSRTPVPVM
ncbi:MAG: hypothetical protein A2408_03580 [Candidatus Yonathbacteria bacterium RIFOXYC1_FULL_52_10]|uniref:GGDEF domain-containing protein n=1 Tax=Candidatus Yonathbacteria bacterium RIFOXYD1_FULL_52_36 TaxID=1802730 RepID=A0A1G2SK73_9BACT|nr:MAG: hypothetical protein A2408_03580 [Candidatus Yonathbacteria bacterium RIFOXYC1_FULL_52_10]OHA85009.1 MAG: hypothetical protein A2591_02200 [Candidatus Yonathbacteria bacterium RIFOXYD1_FULL_52_36]